MKKNYIKIIHEWYIVAFVLPWKLIRPHENFWIVLRRKNIEQQCLVSYGKYI